jgi:hypothetical protein
MALYILWFERTVVFFWNLTKIYHINYKLSINFWAINKNYNHKSNIEIRRYFSLAMTAKTGNFSTFSTRGTVHYE